MILILDKDYVKISMFHRIHKTFSSPAFRIGLQIILQIFYTPSSKNSGVPAF